MMGSEREQGHEQQFCLRWHNYQSSLLATLPQLLDGDDLTDVTLCAGGRNLKAHRVVLSACSQYFKDLFKEMQPMQHPVIVLPGTDFTDLCALVTFMYSGEVNIYQHQLTSLLAMADTLHIRGLAEFTGAGCLTTDPVKKEIATSVQRCKRAKVGPTTAAASTVCSPDENVPTAPTKTKQKVAKTKLESENYVNWPSSVELGNQDQNMAEDLSQRMLSVTDLTEQSGVQHDIVPVEMETQTAVPTDMTQGIIETKTRSSASSSKLYATCFVCGKQLSNQYNLRVHMETHQNAYYACSACSHVSRSRDALRKHVSYRHPQTPVDTSRPRHP